jgi:hypothetical protein
MRLEHGPAPRPAALPGYIFFNLAGDVPAEDLVAAYGVRFRERYERVPLVSPIALHVHFRFRLPADWLAREGDAGPGWYQLDAPGLDDHVAAIKRILFNLGYLWAESHVAVQHAERRWTLEGGPPGVFVYARTLAGPSDRGQLLGPDPADVPGRIIPSPLLVRADLETVRKAAEGNSAAAGLGSPGGKRAKDRKGRGQAWRAHARNGRRAG